jgi:uncharacterized protein YecE (DUF72 family)
LPNVHIGTVDLPPQIDRERYFRALAYIELPPTLQANALKRWCANSPPSSLGVTSLALGTSAPLDLFRHEAIACMIFRSPSLFSPSTDNREIMRRFFAETATAASVGPRVWIPDGLWEQTQAIRFANELGIACAFDPLVRAPNTPLEALFDLEVDALYLRIERAQARPLDAAKLEDLAALVEHYEAATITVAFASPTRWIDARNFKKLFD